MYDTATVSWGPPRLHASKRSDTVRLFWPWLRSFDVIRELPWDPIEFQNAMLYHPRAGRVKKLSSELVLAVCCFLWRGPGCEGLRGTCELSELRGWANFKGPYIMCPLADSSALFCKWQCLSMSRSHAHHPLSIQASLSISFLICTPSFYLGPVLWSSPS